MGAMADDPADSGFATTDLPGDAAELEQVARRWRLVVRVVFLALALLMWLAFVEVTAHERRAALAAVEQRDANLGTAVEHYAVRVLRSAAAVHGLLGSTLAGGADAGRLQLLLIDRLLANDAFASLGLCLPGGGLLRAGPQPGWIAPATCAALLASPPAGGETALLPPVEAAGRLEVPIATAIRDDAGELLAVAVATVPAATLLGIMQSVQLEDDTVVVLVGSDGRPRAAWRSRGGHVASAEGFAALQAVTTASGPATAEVAGRPYLVSSREVDRAGLRVQIATLEADALADFAARRARNLLGCILATLGLAVVYVVLLRLQREGLRRARALQRARGELQALNAHLDQQVRERTARLEDAYRQLEAFSYAVAHDVRAPLDAIAGFADALAPSLAGSGNAQDRHYLQRIRANAVRLDELTRHLLELGRLGRADPHRTDVDLSAMAHEVVGQLREREPGRQVDVSVQPGLAAVGDALLLRQVLENLLGNAWKFTARRAQARIAFQADAQAEGEPAFCVSDNGEGFDEAEAGALFQPFRRLHAASDFPGSGVGLATVQRIVALHGGQIRFRARPGEGACFCFSLPGALPAPPQVP